MLLFALSLNYPFQNGKVTNQLGAPLIVIGPKRVFIVDDSDDVRELFVLLAQLNGFILDSAKNGEEALTKLAMLEKEPTIVFVDLSMPVMGGAEFVRKVRESGLAPSARIVIFSAKEKGSEPKLDSALMWLAKPFNLADVLGVINLSHLH